MSAEQGGSEPFDDNGLTWFRPAGLFAGEVWPLKYTLEIHARNFALSHAMQTLYFPLREFRTRLVNGRLYLAVVPSPLAERDLQRQFQRRLDASRRFTMSFGEAWEHLVRPELDEYSHWIEGMADGSATPVQVAEQVRRLRRVRGNQWYQAIRGVFAPAAMFEHRAGEWIGPDGGEAAREVSATVQEARRAVWERGADVLDKALRRVGAMLLELHVIETADDVHWLEWGELRRALEHPESREDLVDERKRAAAPAADDGDPPPVIGPDLPADEPRMYLVQETLALIGEAPSWS